MVFFHDKKMLVSWSHYFHDMQFGMMVYVSCEFSLKDFRWIHWFYWIMTTPKSGKVIRDPCLVIDKYPDEVVKDKSSSRPMSLIRVVSGKRRTFCYYCVCYQISLVTITFLECVMSHWIQGNQENAFRQNPYGISIEATICYLNLFPTATRRHYPFCCNKKPYRKTENCHKEN